MRPGGNGREMRRLLAEVERAGWRMRPSKHGFLVYPPQGSPVTVPGTPGDVRSVRNTAAQLRRAGLIGRR
jgi:hypothetical protein